MIVLCLSCLGLAAGCADRQTPAARPPAETAAADSAVALLGRADDAALRGAFEGVSTLYHARYMRTEQFDADGARIAYDERVVRGEGEDEGDGWGGQVVARDTAGTFDFGYINRFVPPSPDAANSADLTGFPAYVLPDDPAYASRRNMEAYRYDLFADTTLHGRAVRLVRISALPGVGDRQSIRRARVFLEKETDRLVGLYVERIETALWFREESALFASIDRLPSGRWVPKLTRFETMMQLPFRPPQRFRAVTSYYAFRTPAGRE